MHPAVRRLLWPWSSVPTTVKRAYSCSAKRQHQPQWEMLPQAPPVVFGGGGGVENLAPSNAVFKLRALPDHTRLDVGKDRPLR